MFIVPQPKRCKIKSPKVFTLERSPSVFRIAATGSILSLNETLDIIQSELTSVFNNRVSFIRQDANVVSDITLAVIGTEDISHERNDYAKWLDDKEKSFIRQIKTPQAYLLKSVHNHENNEKYIILAAQDKLGILYAVMTLIQLISLDRGHLIIPDVSIQDYPDVQYRIGARWLLCGEACRWSYDWGDGREKLLTRFKSKIDFCMRHKINMVFFDGFSWNHEKYPGYAQDMRMLNMYAAARGVKLIFGGHGIGVGGCGKDAMLAEAHDSPRGLGGDMNRKSYPDGEPYPCSGNNPKIAETRYNGTCRSNDALNEMKKRDLAEYVRQIEPRALYIHHEDQNLFYEEGQKVFWDLRCPACRAKWADDRLEKIGGGASAIAHGYDVLCEAVASVKNSATGYDGARDCTMILVSPAYGAVYETDEIWDKTVELWTNISKEMKYADNIIFGIREQLQRKDTGAMRVKQFTDSINEHGSGHGVLVFAVGGADLYLNDALFSATPAMNVAFEGASAIFNFSGIIFQEPQMLFNAEYQWNLKSPHYYEKLTSYEDTIALYNQYSIHRKIPDFLKAADGFLAQICRYLYGQNAGEEMKQLYLSGTETGEYPLCLMYYKFSLKKFFKRYAEFSPDQAKKEKISWENILDQTEKGLKLVGNALKCRDFKESLRQDVEFLYKCLRVGKMFAQTVCGILGDKPSQKAELNAGIGALEQYIANNFDSDFSSPGNGDSELWPGYIQKLKDIIAKCQPSA